MAKVFHVSDQISHQENRFDKKYFTQCVFIVNGEIWEGSPLKFP